MNIIKAKQLTSTQKTEILALTDSCKKTWNTSLSFPLEEGTSFYLLYHPALVCALALTIAEHDLTDREEIGTTAECVAFTHPAMLQRGYFSTLLEAAEEEIQDMDLLFLIDGSNEGAKKTLDALDAELEMEEYRLELLLDTASDPETQAAARRLFAVPHKDGDHICLTFHLNAAPDSEAGRAYAAFYEDSVCLFGFELAENLRGRGLAREALSLFTDYVKSEGTPLIFLHVSGDNLPALKLYKKTGFRITETLSYYLY